MGEFSIKNVLDHERDAGPTIDCWRERRRGLRRQQRGGGVRGGSGPRFGWRHLRMESEDKLLINALSVSLRRRHLKVFLLIKPRRRTRVPITRVHNIKITNDLRSLVGGQITCEIAGMAVTCMNFSFQIEMRIFCLVLFLKETFFL